MIMKYIHIKYSSIIIYQSYYSVWNYNLTQSNYSLIRKQKYTQHKYTYTSISIQIPVFKKRIYE